MRDKMKNIIINIIFVPLLLFVSCTQSSKLNLDNDVSYPARMLRAGAKKAVDGKDENPDFTITIKTTKQIYIQGQKIDVLVTIQNKTGNTIIVPGLFITSLTDIDSNMTIEGDGSVFYWGGGGLSIAPHGKYMSYSSPCDEADALSPVKTMARLPWAVFYPGNFDFYIEYIYKKIIYKSNHVNFKILSVPDSLRASFQDVMAESQLVPGGQDISYPGYLKALANSKGGFYERECLEKILSAGSYQYVFWGDSKTEFLYSKAVELYEEFMLKYPDNRFSQFMWKFILDARRIKNNNELLTKVFNRIFDASHMTNINYQELYEVINCYSNNDDAFKSFLKGIGKDK